MGYMSRCPYNSTESYDYFTRLCLLFVTPVQLQEGFVMDGSGLAFGAMPLGWGKVRCEIVQIPAQHPSYLGRIAGYTFSKQG